VRSRSLKTAEAITPTFSPLARRPPLDRHRQALDQLLHVDVEDLARINSVESEGSRGMLHFARTMFA
jgi:hypothetical protein